MSEQFVPEIRVAGFDSEWTKASLDSLVGRFYGGGTPSKSDERYWQGNIPWIQSSDLSVEEIAGVHPVKFVSDEAVKRSATQIIPPNSIAVVTRVGVGKVAVMDDAYATSQDFASLCDVNGDPHFLARTLQRRISLDLGFLQGSTIKGMTVAELKSKVISFPPPHEQRLIGGLFKALDDTISSHQQKHRQLQQAKASLMQRMFPAPGASEPEIRVKGFTGGWRTLELGEFSIKTGPFGSSLHAEDYVERGTPIVTTEHFKTGRLPRDGAGVPQVSDSDVARLSTYKLEVGDIVFSRVGSVDLNAVTTPKQVGWLFSGRVLRVRPTAGHEAQFLHAVLETDHVRQSLVSRAVGQTMPSLNTQILGATEILVAPTVAEQQAIGAFFSKLDDLIEAEAQYVSKLQQVKSALLQKMLV